MQVKRARNCRRHWASCGRSDLLFIRNLVAEKSGHNCPKLFRFRVGDVQVHYGGRCNRFAYAPASPGIRVPRGPARWYSRLFASPPPSVHPPTPFPSAILPTIAAANTFPGTRVMILLYYANYAVAAHGQWCILMAIVAQRGAIAIDQSCSGYANSSSTWRTRSAESEAREGGWWKMMETGNGWWRGQNNFAISTKSLYCHFVTATC